MARLVLEKLTYEKTLTQSKCFFDLTNESPSEAVHIDVDEPVTNTFSLKFLNSFCRGDSLSESVNLMMSENTPLVVEYKIHNIGQLKFYLAPKLQEQ